MHCVRLAALAAVLAMACGPSGSSEPGDDGDDDDGDSAGSDGGIQVENACPDGSSTTLSGRVVAPNGADPIPFARVYVPSQVNPFPDGASCDVCSDTTGSALVSTVSEVDGTFTLGPIPTREDQPPGETIQLVAQKGRFRQVETVTIDTPCGANGSSDVKYALPSQNAGEDTIPNIAVVTGQYDVMECVLRELGLAPGSFDLYNGIKSLIGGTPGVEGQFNTLLGDLDRMKQYNIIFINCSDNDYESLLGNAGVRSNIESYVSAGGRLYVTDWSYDYLEQVPALAPVIDFAPSPSGDAPEARNQAAVGKGGIEIDASILDDGMSSWLAAVEEVTGDDIISDQGKVHIEHFLGDWAVQLQVPTRDESKVWLEGPVSGGGISGVKALTTTYDHQECGRVLYSSYHTAGGRRQFPTDSFPGYCGSQKLSPQEHVLLYLILHVADCIGDVE
jgi:hypothetical protein